MNDTIERSQAHATFVLERTYPVPLQAVRLDQLGSYLVRGR
jgi:hypothetical protein